MGHRGAVGSERDTRCIVGRTDGGEQQWSFVRTVTVSPKRQNELNCSGRSLRTTSGSRSRAFAAHGRAAKVANHKTLPLLPNV